MDFITPVIVGLVVAALSTIVFSSGRFGLVGDIGIGIAGAGLGAWGFGQLGGMLSADLPDYALATAIGAAFSIAALRLARPAATPAR